MTDVTPPALFDVHPDGQGRCRDQYVDEMWLYSGYTVAIQWLYSGGGRGRGGLFSQTWCLG